MPSPILFQLATLEVRSKAEKISHLIIKNWKNKLFKKNLNNNNRQVNLSQKQLLVMWMTVEDNRTKHNL